MEPILTHRTLTEGAEQILRRMILKEELLPSERINEVQLAEQLNISRGPIREALRRLQSEGLLVYYPHKGTFVKTLSRKEAHEMYTLRGLLEGEAARLALGYITGEQIRTLESLVEEFDIAVKEKDKARLIQCDLKFHHIIVSSSKHSRLSEMYKSLDTQLEIMFTTIQRKVPSRYSQLAELHRILVDAIKSGDEQVVTNEFREHYEAAWRTLSTVLSEE